MVSSMGKRCWLVEPSEKCSVSRDRVYVWEIELMYKSNLFSFFKYKQSLLKISFLKWWGAQGVMVTVVGNEHGNTSSNPGRD